MATSKHRVIRTASVLLMTLVLAFVFSYGSGVSEVVAATAKPAKVTELKAVKTTSSQIDLSWKEVKAVKVNDTTKNVSYQVKKTWGKNSSKTYFTKTPSYQLKSLKSGTKYTVKVRAYYKNSAGKKVYGKWSAARTV